MSKKHLALHGKRVHISQKNVYFGGRLPIIMTAKGVAPPLLNDITRQVGGLLIGDTNIAHGGKINRVPQRKPIKFLV